MNDAKPTKVLVVEDDADLAMLVALVLRAEGFTVELADNGKVALERLERGPADLIVLDMKMPVMNGQEFVRAYRARYATGVPIIVVTAAENARRRAREVGADAWLGKPFDPDALVALVRRVASSAAPTALRTSDQ